MHSIRINKRIYHLPSGWGELTPDQVKKVAKIRGEGFQRNLQALFLLATKRLRRVLSQIDPAKVSAIADCLNWLQEKREAAEATDEVFPLVKSFKIGRKRYYFPQESLNDVTVNEWKWADHYINQIGENPQDAQEHIIGLLAVVARPLRPEKERLAKDYDGYPRERFNPERIVHFEEKFKSAPGWVYYVLDDYISRCQEMLKARYGPVFEGDKSDGPNWGWTGITMSIGEVGIYGNEKEVEKENIHNVCLYLSKKILDDREFQRKLKEMKNARS